MKKKSQININKILKKVNPYKLLLLCQIKKKVLLHPSQNKRLVCNKKKNLNHDSFQSF